MFELAQNYSKSFPEYSIETTVLSQLNDSKCIPVDLSQA
jgi:hypothetical protein